MIPSSKKYGNRKFNYKYCQTDAMLDEAFGSQVTRQGRMSLSDNTAGNDTSTAMTRVSSTPPTPFVDIPCSQQTKEATMHSPYNNKEIAD